MWVPVTTALRVGGLRMEETVTTIWRVAGNILNNQTQIADWRLVYGLTTPFRKVSSLLRNVTQSLETGRIHWNNLDNGKWKI
jgi:hypothetical protein